MKTTLFPCTEWYNGIKCHISIWGENAWCEIFKKIDQKSVKRLLGSGVDCWTLQRDLGRQLEYCESHQFTKVQEEYFPLHLKPKERLDSEFDNYALKFGGCYILGSFTYSNRKGVMVLETLLSFLTVSKNMGSCVRYTQRKSTWTHCCLVQNCQKEFWRKKLKALLNFYW